jgi:hypothetical protein
VEVWNRLGDLIWNLQKGIFSQIKNPFVSFFPYLPPEEEHNSGVSLLLFSRTSLPNCLNPIRDPAFVKRNKGMVDLVPNRDSIPNCFYKVTIG